MKPSKFDYMQPATIEEALNVLAAHNGDAKPLAGGQSLMPLLAFRLAAPSLLVDISRLPGLGGITIDSDGIRLGALVRWRDIEGNNALREHHPLLHAAIGHVAHYQIRNRGTVGGSLAHADPAAEMPGVAVACDAQLTIASTSGKRIVAAEDFFISALVTDLAPDELITEVRLPPWKPKRIWTFEEFARRRGDFALAGIALFYDPDEDGRARNVHLGAIGVADRPIRLRAAEAILEGRRVDADAIMKVAVAARAAVDPPDDIHASSAYRRALIGVLIERGLSRAAGVGLHEAA